jgi:2-oxoglutarate ferredoxin oxidoreductase subunit beta
MNAPLAIPLQAKDFKSDYKPVWCPGCGDYSVLAAITKALAMLEAQPHEVAVVSGIGCSSRIPAYTTCYGFHGVHGRSLPAATGLKVARPELTVLVASGDGDGYSIGGNHFLHACRRNVDLTYIVMDNHVYGMTKGQPSPTTEPDWSSKLAPGGTGTARIPSAGDRARLGGQLRGARLLRRSERLRGNHRRGGAPSGILLRRDALPCVTFRPEQRAWKDAVHAGAGGADRRSGARGAADHDRRRLQYRRALQGRAPHPIPAARRRRPRHRGSGMRIRL